MTNVTLTLYAYLGSWTDITSDVSARGVSAVWGMASNNPVDNLAKTGQMSFSLNNSTGKYTPNGVSVIHSSWGKGTKVKAVFTYGGASYVRFYGSINSIRIDAGTTDNRNVHCTVLDWMHYATNYPINNPAIEQEIRVDEAIDTILTGMPIQPLATNIDTGAITMPVVFNSTTLQTKAYSEFQKFVSSELGSYIYVQKDATYGETLRFENSANRAYAWDVKQVSTGGGSLLMETGDALLLETGDNILLESDGATYPAIIDNTMTSMDVVYGDNLINRITVTVHPPRIDTKDTQIFSLDSSLYMAVDDEKTFFVDFTENDSKRRVTALPPDTSYPITLFHFDAPGEEELVIDEAGKPWDDYSLELVTNVKKIGVSSLYFDGSGSYAQGSTSQDYEFGSGDFTVEWWEYRFNAASGTAVLSRDGGGSYPPFSFGYADGTNSLVYITSNGSSWDIANGKSFGAISTTTWTHYAITRSGTTFRMFTNGTKVQEWTSSASIRASSNPMVIGKYGSSYITACIDEMRIVKGYAAYTADFTAPTEPFVLSGTIYAAWTNANGTGTELTENFLIDITYGAAGGEITVTNNGSTAGYLTTLKIFGKLVDTISAVTDVQENQDSIEAYGYFDLSIDQPYQADFTSGREVAASILDYNKTPLIRVDKIVMNANRDAQHMLCFLQTDIGDNVGITEDQTETNTTFWIQGMGWNASAGGTGAIVDFWWNVKKSRENLVELGIDVNSFPDSIVFGYLPQIAVENVPHRIFSIWLNQEDGFAISSLMSFVSEGNTPVYGTISIDISKRIAVHQYWGATRAHWRTSTGAVTSLNTWYHVLVDYDASSSTNDPAIYVNGVSKTVSEITSPTGTVTSDALKIFRIGHIAGKFKDARVYNGANVSDVGALALGLYNEGAYGDDYTTGLLFRSFYAPSDVVSTYYGALTSDMKVVDNVGFSIGTPTNTPDGYEI